MVKKAGKQEDKKAREWSRYLSAVLYGYAGSGKSGFCVRAAEHVGWERTLWLHADSNVPTFEVPQYTKTSPFGLLNLQLEPIEKIIFAANDAAMAAAHGQWKYDLIVLDSVSELEFVNIASIEETKGGSKSGKKSDGRQVWGQEMDDVWRLMWTLAAGARGDKHIGMGAHLLMTAHVSEHPHPTMPKDADGNPVFILRPHMRGYWGKGLDHLLDAALYSERAQTGRRKLYLKPTGSIHVLNRFETRDSPATLDIPEIDAEENPFAQLLDIFGIEEI